MSPQPAPPVLPVDRPTGGPQVGLPPAPQERGRPLTDGGAVLVAAAVALGAWWHRPWPLAMGAVAVGAALLARRPWLLVAGGFLLAGTLGQRAVDGLDPVVAGPHREPVVLLGDPRPMPFGARADVRVGERRVELWASGSAAGALEASLAGERLWVEGRLRPPPEDAPWLVPRHVVGRLDATRAERLDGGALPWQVANRFRRLLDRGSEVLPEPTRSLYAGFVLGDDRGQPPEVVDDFRGAGLTHLLVVSGQNVAFVLVVVGPLVRRLGLAARWAATVGVIGAFGVLTRFEPSVLRASAMAALAVTASVSGRPASTLRLLALAVAGLVLVDPLLVHAVGFQLSVAASAGIAVLAGPIGERVPGPRWLAEAVGVTVGAQLGVAPVLVPRFGGMPVVALAANVVAVPVAGLVTTWGLPAGAVAGLAGPAVARLVHLPTRWLVAWVAAVARVAASVPLGELGARHLVVLVAIGVVVAVLARHRPTWVAARRVLAVLGVVALLSPAWALRSPPPRQVVAEGAVLHHRPGGATVLELTGEPDVEDLLQGLRRAGARRLDAVATPEPLGPELDRALRHRWPVGRVVVTAPTPSGG